MLRAEHRFSGYLPSETSLAVSLAGVGAVGSHVAKAAWSMRNVAISAHDPDVVKMHNVGVQAYSPQHVGLTKTEALGYVLEERAPRSATNLLRSSTEDLNFKVFQGINDLWNSDSDLVIHSALTTEQDPTTKLILVLGVDSIEARREIMEEVLNKSVLFKHPIHVLDFRAAIRLFECHYVQVEANGETSKAVMDYLEALPDESQTLSEPCDAQMSPAIGLYSAAYALSCIQQILRGDAWKIPKHQMLDIENFMSSGWEGASEPAQAA